MPIPAPVTDESRENFMGRCMSDPTMVNEYEPAQRYAVCNAKWESKRDERSGTIGQD